MLTEWPSVEYKQYRNTIYHQGIGYNVDIMRQTVCLMVNPITIYNFATLLPSQIARQCVEQQTQWRLNPKHFINGLGLMLLICVRLFLLAICWDFLVFWLQIATLLKHFISNRKKISPPKTENFQIKNWYFSYFCSKHRLCVLVRTASGGGFNEYPHSMFSSRNKKNNVYPCKPQFYNIKVGLHVKGVNIM